MKWSVKCYQIPLYHILKDGLVKFSKVSKQENYRPCFSKKKKPETDCSIYSRINTGILRLFFRKNIPWENRIERESKEFKEKLYNIKFTYYLLFTFTQKDGEEWEETKWRKSEKRILTACLSNFNFNLEISQMMSFSTIFTSSAEWNILFTSSISKQLQRCPWTALQCSWFSLIQLSSVPVERNHIDATVRRHLRNIFQR